MFEHLKVIIKNKSQFLVKTNLKSFGLDIEMNFTIKIQSRSAGKAKIWFKVFFLELGRHLWSGIHKKSLRRNPLFSSQSHDHHETIFHTFFFCYHWSLNNGSILRFKYVWGLSVELQCCHKWQFQDDDSWTARFTTQDHIKSLSPSLYF